MELSNISDKQEKSFLLPADLPIGGRKSGFLSLRFGPMKSQKTVWLKLKATMYSDAFDRKVIFIHYEGDGNRLTASNDGGISSHSSTRLIMSPKVTVKSCTRLSEVDVSDFEVCMVEEAQFFPDLVETVTLWHRQCKIIYCVGLDGNFKRGKFGRILDLIPLADEAEKVTAMCEDCTAAARTLHNEHPGVYFDTSGSRAPFTAKIGDDQIEIEVGAQKYVPVCDYHYRLRHPKF